MSSRRDLALELSEASGFENPRADLEQYRTPPDIAATIVHTADLQGDLGNRLVLDLGCGTGMLALGSAFRNPARVVAVELDAGPLETALENERRLDPPVPVSWVRGDATRPPCCPPESQETTVLMNPPFGAQRGNEHADKAFLGTACRIADVSYSIHNAGSREFVESFAADNGGEVTHAFEAEFELPRAFEFHSEESRTIVVEVFRVDW